jgi:cob(I)alamin adenosyltransferase
MIFVLVNKFFEIFINRLSDLMFGHVRNHLK